MGRTNDGWKDFKGITSNVTIDGKAVQNWITFGLPLDDITRLNNFTTNNTKSKLPSFWSGQFTISDDPKDTFLSLLGWSKGVAFINGFNLGRYWPQQGPQQTLYVPRTVVKQGENKFVLLELEGSPSGCLEDEKKCLVELVQEPKLDGPTPKNTHFGRRPIHHHGIF